jgi:hypothetical protein
MALVRLTAEVFCNRSEGEPTYRVYVDDDLLTERSWVWPAYEVFVREYIEVEVEPGAHRLTISECNCDPVFEIKNAMVNDAPLAASGVFFV